MAEQGESLLWKEATAVTHLFGEGQGKGATTCQAGGSIEAVWIQRHLLDLHMWLHWITVS